MDKGGQTVSATRFAELTGLTRERLRTWERRHGFPKPRRAAGGPRRYALADAQRVVAVRHAVEAGVPLHEAIARAAAPPSRAEPGAAAFRAAVEHAPRPILLLSGPDPTRVEAASAGARALPGRPRAGEELAVPELAGSDLETALRAQFVGRGAPVEVEHPAWGGPDGEPGRFVLYRLPIEPDPLPLVVMLGMSAAREREARAALAELRGESDELRRDAERRARWLDAAAQLARQFREEPETALLTSTADTLVRQLGAVDCAIAPYMAGQLVLGRSSRGLLGPEMVTVAGYDDLAAAVREGEPTWLAPGSAAAFGTPEGLCATAVPVEAAGETLGAVILVFDEVEEIDSDVRRMLAIVSAAVGFALLRDRYADALREPGV